MKKFFLLILIGFVLILNSVNAQNLIGYWKFDEGSGSTALDSSGYGNDGVLYGGLDTTGWTSDCISGSCLNFDGIDDYVKINNFGDFSNGFSIIFWFNMKQKDDTQRPFFSNYFSTCYFNPSMNMPCWLCDGTSCSSSLDTSGWSYDVWTYFAMTYDTATGNWIIYRNGASVKTSSYGHTMNMVNDFLIGANCWTTGCESPFNGTIDEVKIYNRALTSNEVLADYTETGTTSSSTTLTSTTITTTETTTSTPPGQVTISGQLSNSSGSIEALVTLFNPGTSQVNKSESTVDGDYSLDIWPGAYDLQYNIYHIPNFFIKLLSLTINSNLQNILDNFNGLSNGISFEVDITEDEEILVYSDKEPLSVKANDIELTKVFSSPATNEWYYTSGEVRMIVSPTLPTTSTTTSTTTTSSTLTTSPTTTIYIPAEADYYVTGSPSNYEAINVSDGQTLFSGSNAATVINDVLDKMKSGQTVAFSGDFTITSTVTVNVANILLDFSQATVDITVNIGFRVNKGYVTFYGGQYDPFTNTGTHSVWTGTTTAIQMWYEPGSVFDGFELTGFTGGGTVVVLAYGSSNITVQNCYFHGNTNSDQIGFGGGNNFIINCKIDCQGQGIMDNGGGQNNKIIGCEFYNWNRPGGHAIYLDAGPTRQGGYNEVANCTFHDGVNGAGLHIKSKNNNIHHNNFYNFFYNGSIYTVPFSIYSQYTGSEANDNDIHHNTFNNCDDALWINGAGESTDRNKIHDNVFTNVTNCICLNHYVLSNWVNDTWIYYNKFVSCANVIRVTTSSPPNMVANTVVAYNDFSQTSIPDLRFEVEYQNTMVYGNIGIDDFNVPDPLPIPPP